MLTWQNWDCSSLVLIDCSTADTIAGMSPLVRGAELSDGENSTGDWDTAGRVAFFLLPLLFNEGWTVRVRLLPVPRGRTVPEEVCPSE